MRISTYRQRKLLSRHVKSPSNDVHYVFKNATYLLNSLADLSHRHDKIDVGDAVDLAQHDGEELSAVYRLLLNDTRVINRCALTAH